MTISNIQRGRRTGAERWRAPGLGGPPDTGLLARRLGRLAELTDEETALLESLATTFGERAAGTELVREGEALDTPRLLVAGWACRFRTLPDGRRQIFAFTLPGDLYGLCVRPDAVALTPTVALTPVVVADAAPLGEAIKDKADTHPGLAKACFAMASLEEAYLLNQLMRIGRQTAYERTAHLMLEIQQRLIAVGLADESSVGVPLTQEIMADALGLSVVHLNRTLQQLRRDRLMEFKNGLVKVLEPERLAKLADFRKTQFRAPQRQAAA